MKIGIDISQIVYGTGVSTYTKNLVENLFKIDTENNYILFGGSLRRKKDILRFTNKLDSKNFSTKIVGISPSIAHILWNKLHILKIEKLIGKIDIFHSSDWTEPPSNAHKITTIHDLAPLRYPKLTNPKIIAVHKAKLKWVKREVERIIVPSLATKDDLTLLKFDRKKICVIPEAVDSFFKPIRKGKKIVRSKYKARNYILAVGGAERKNIGRLIKAYELIRAGKDLKLIVVGRQSKEYGGIRGVRFTGHISRRELRILYSNAQVLVYPSLYEGFGLPILEAFACKCPVVASNISSMPEVSGEKAAILVDPFDVNSIVEGIEKALGRREILIKLGQERLKAFSWKRVAKETFKVYEELQG